MKRVIFFISMLVITGCSVKNASNFKSCENNKLKDTLIKKVSYSNKVCIINNKLNKNCILTIRAKGLGIVPYNEAYSLAQQKIMARRAAILDSYRALIEKIYGIEINGKDSVKNMALKSSSLWAHIQGLVRGANIEEESYKNGIYTIVMSIKLNVADWNKYIENINYSSN